MRLQSIYARSRFSPAVGRVKLERIVMLYISLFKVDVKIPIVDLGITRDSQVCGVPNELESFL